MKSRLPKNFPIENAVYSPYGDEEEVLVEFQNREHFGLIAKDVETGEEFFISYPEYAYNMRRIAYGSQFYFTHPKLLGLRMCNTKWTTDKPDFVRRHEGSEYQNISTSLDRGVAPLFLVCLLGLAALFVWAVGESLFRAPV